jgi:signal transduction histidine kinase
MPLTASEPSEPRIAQLPFLLGIIVVAVLLIGGAAGWYGWATSAEEWTKQSADQGKVLAASVAPAVVDLLKQGKADAAGALVKDLKNKAGLVYVEVLRSGSATPFASSFPQADPPERRSRLSQAGNAIQQDEVAGVPVLNVTTEVRDGGTLLGTVHLGIDQSRIYWGRMALLGLTVVEALLILGIGFVVLHPFVRTATGIRAEAGVMAEHMKNLETSFNEEKAARQQLEADLKKARNATVSASRAKNTFLADLSQQLRAPMRQIAQTAELALGADPAPRLREHLQHLRSSTSELMTLVNDLLDFAQMDVGQLQLESVDFRLSELLDKLLRAPAMRAHAKNLRLDFDVGENVPETVMGDPTRLRQVLYHLVDNAVKYTSRGSITVALDVMSLAPHEARLRFTISDTGIGIPVWKKDTLFDPAALEEARAHGATGGLSLAMSGMVVQRMGGKIEVESQVGHGSKFWFAVPFRLPEKSSRLLELPKPKERIKMRVILPRSRAKIPGVQPASAVKE